MLNISKESVHKKITLTDYKSGIHISNGNYYHWFNRLSIIFLVMLSIILFLPWTQNITGNGNVTTLTPGQRPQIVQSAIPGRIEQWYVNEGDYVKSGDTILRISEIKSDYFDDKLIERTASQIQSKNASIIAYRSKIEALNDQINALKQAQILTIEQARNSYLQAKYTVISDSTDLLAADWNRSIAKKQYNRIETLQKEGLKSVKDVEERQLQLQATSARYITIQNKLLESKNKVINAKLELSRLNASYLDKIAKSQSDLFSAESALNNAEIEISKLENSLANFSKRYALQYITAAQNGYINKVLKGAIGETFKEGENLVRVMPAQYQQAVETYVRPLDLPLIHIGEKVRVQFDGWPAIVFNGWESVSYGTYGAKVVAIENYISDNGMYRVLLAPDANDHTWPTGIRVGSGAKTIALLNDVPIWYELWRQLNGFPPNFYTPKNNSVDSSQ